MKPFVKTIFALPVTFIVSAALCLSESGLALDIDEDGLDSTAEITAGTDAARSDTDYDMIVDGWEVQQAQSPVSPRYSLDLNTTVGTKPGLLFGCVLDIKQNACAYDDQGKKCWQGTSTVLPRTSATRTAQTQITTRTTTTDRLYMAIECSIQLDGAITCQAQNRQRYNHVGNPCNYGSGILTSTVSGNLSVTIPAKALQIAGKDGLLCALVSEGNSNLQCWNVFYTGTNVHDDITVTSLNFSPMVSGSTLFFDADLDGIDNIPDLDDDNDGVLDAVDAGHYNPFSPMALDANYNGSAIQEQQLKL